MGADCFEPVAAAGNPFGCVPYTGQTERPHAKQVTNLAVQSFPDILGNRHSLQRARIARLLRPDAGFAALGRDLARGVAEHMADGEGASAKPRDVTFDDKSLARLRGALEGAFGGHQRRALRPLPAARVVVRDAGRDEQPVARLVAPAEVGRVIDDAGGIAIAPFDRHLVPATQRHDAAPEQPRRWPPGSWTAPRP